MTRASLQLDLCHKMSDRGNSSIRISLIPIQSPHILGNEEKKSDPEKGGYGAKGASLLLAV